MEPCSSPALSSSGNRPSPVRSIAGQSEAPARAGAGGITEKGSRKSGNKEGNRLAELSHSHPWRRTSPSAVPGDEISVCLLRRGRGAVHLSITEILDIFLGHVRVGRLHLRHAGLHQRLLVSRAALRRALIRALAARALIRARARALIRRLRLHLRLRV